MLNRHKCVVFIPGGGETVPVGTETCTTVTYGNSCILAHQKLCKKMSILLYLTGSYLVLTSLETLVGVFFPG